MMYSKMLSIVLEVVMVLVVIEILLLVGTRNTGRYHWVGY